MWNVLWPSQEVGTPVLGVAACSYTPVSRFPAHQSRIPSTGGQATPNQQMGTKAPPYITPHARSDP